MAQTKLQDALNEGRILILGSQVIIGFQWRAVFEKGFYQLPMMLQYLALSSLLMMLLVLALLIAPACFHTIVCRGEDTKGMHRFTTHVTEAALFPFAASLGISLFLASFTVISPRFALATGIVSFLLALFSWFGIESISLRRPEKFMEPMDQNEPTPLWLKIEHVLTEARMVLPGVQALLGFQFIIFFTDLFQALPEFSKMTHLISLFLVALSIILLMSPAAFHRIVEGGEDTERFYQVANRFVLAAMVPLAIATSADFYVVAAEVSRNPWAAFGSSLALLVFFLGFWFGYTFYLRLRK